MPPTLLAVFALAGFDFAEVLFAFDFEARALLVLLPLREPVRPDLLFVAVVLIAIS